MSTFSCLKVEAPLRLIPVHSTRVHLDQVLRGEVLVCPYCFKCAWNKSYGLSLQCPHCYEILKYEVIDEVASITPSQPPSFWRESEPALIVSDAIRTSIFFSVQRPINSNVLFKHGGMSENYKRWPFARQHLCAEGSFDTWWRIPRHGTPQVLPASERHSVYASFTTSSPMIGFHRTSWQVITAHGRIVPDWLHNDTLVVYPSNIIAEGLVRNGIKDSNHRGVWFYLGFQHPYAPDRDTIVVELEVVQSSTHKGAKWHLKYCAADSPAGEPNKWARVLALHVPSSLLTQEFIQQLV